MLNIVNYLTSDQKDRLAGFEEGMEGGAFKVLNICYAISLLLSLFSKVSNWIQ